MDSCTYGLGDLHLEVRALDEHVQFGNVEKRTVSPVWFWDGKHADVKRCMVKLRVPYAINLSHIALSSPQGAEPGVIDCPAIETEQACVITKGDTLKSI